MARTSARPENTPITDYRYPDKRKNIPPAGLAAQGKVAEGPGACLMMVRNG